MALTSVCVISGELCEIARPFTTTERNVRLHPEKFQLDQIRNGRPAAIINMRNI